MRKLLFLTTLILSLSFINCNNSSNESSSNSDDSVDGYEDGTYCADVEYYYSETGTRSSYTLLAEIEDNELVKIHWPNGGWLDNSHFSPPDIESGTSNFRSDRGVDYTVRILGEEGDCTPSAFAKDEDDLIREKEDEEYQERRDKEEEEDRVQEEDDRKKRIEREEQEEEDRKREEEEERKRNEDEEN